MKNDNTKWSYSPFKISNNALRKKIEEYRYESFHKNNFNDWVSNFALNLEHIWNELSASELDPTPSSKKTLNNKSCIIIGSGPSAKKHKHLELLSASDYNGSILCTDDSLVRSLKAGITPVKFPNFYVTTIDPFSRQQAYYDDPIINEFGNKIKGIFSTITHPSVLERARESGIKIHWLHTLFDYDEGQKSFNNISALITRAKKHVNGLPAIQTSGNVGTSSWFIGWRILKCSTVAMVGIDIGWEIDSPVDVILQYHPQPVPKNIDPQHPILKKILPKIYNPDFDTYCNTDQIFEYYTSGFKEFISRSPRDVNTINATEGGVLFGDRINCMPFKSFLSKFKS